MAKRSRMSVLKRQRELRKSEKAARKRAKRHGTLEGGFSEPQPTFRLSDAAKRAESDDKAAEPDADAGAGDESGAGALRPGR